MRMRLPERYVVMGLTLRYTLKFNVLLTAMDYAGV